MFGLEKIKEAKEKIKRAQDRHEANVNRYNSIEKKAEDAYEAITRKKSNIKSEFLQFTRLISQIHNRPKFDSISSNEVDLRQFRLDQLSSIPEDTPFERFIKIQAAVILFPTIMAFAFTLGPIWLNYKGNKMLEKADEAWAEMEKAEKEIQKVIPYFVDIENTAHAFLQSLNRVESVYRRYFERLDYTVNRMHKKDCNDFSDEEQLVLKNLCIVVALLFNMCKVELLLKTNDGKISVNHSGVDRLPRESNEILRKIERGDPSY